LSGRYTMQSERVLHASVMQGNGAGDCMFSTEEASAGMNWAEDGLGANVELF